MKKIVSVILALTLCLAITACGNTTSSTTTSSGTTSSETAGTDAAGSDATGDDVVAYTVGICQLMEHESLDKATQGFIDALTEEIEKEGKTVTIDTQVAGEANLCTTVINTFTAKEVDLIMANATPALLAAANATTTIPVLGTSVTDYADTFGGNIPANVSGTSDAVPFDEQAQMMINTLGLTAGDKVGVLYCTNESNSLIQYNAVKELFEAEGIVVEAYTFSETTELQALVNSAAGSCKAIYVPSDNTVAQNDSIVGTICTENNVPVFTSYGGEICYASLAIDYYELGRETGKMAAEVLLGKTNVEDIEIKTLVPTVVYNDELCAQLGITIPEN
ncbi:MAG: ABC transporter substrate-binding protein [Lachnospiraceae bacterium]|nr:ABC transporter substrate-binding protein [Lachnospiraceae bacterium]